MATTKARKLGKEYRLFIATKEGTSADPLTDADYEKVTNENSLTATRSANVQENSTKEEGTINNPGDESHEISFDFNEIYEDAGLDLLEAAFNKPWMYQIRRVVGSAQSVVTEGEFILSELEFTAESQDVRSGSATLVKSGEVVGVKPPRVVTVTP